MNYLISNFKIYTYRTLKLVSLSISLGIFPPKSLFLDKSLFYSSIIIFFFAKIINNKSNINYNYYNKIIIIIFNIIIFILYIIIKFFLNLQNS